MGFAIPVDSVRGSVEQIINLGRVVHPVIGIAFAPDAAVEDVCPARLLPRPCCCCCTRSLDLQLKGCRPLPPAVMLEHAHHPGCWAARCWELPDCGVRDRWHIAGLTAAKRQKLPPCFSLPGLVCSYACCCPAVSSFAGAPQVTCLWH